MRLQWDCNVLGVRDNSITLCTFYTNATSRTSSHSGTWFLYKKRIITRRKCESTCVKPCLRIQGRYPLAGGGADEKAGKAPHCHGNRRSLCEVGKREQHPVSHHGGLTSGVECLKHLEEQAQIIITGLSCYCC